MEIEFNCIVINGKCHVLREVELHGISICKECSLYDICYEMIECPICEVLHGVPSDGHVVYKLLEDGDKGVSESKG